VTLSYYMRDPAVRYGANSSPWCTLHNLWYYFQVLSPPTLFICICAIYVANSLLLFSQSTAAHKIQVAHWAYILVLYCAKLGSGLPPPHF